MSQVITKHTKLLHPMHSPGALLMSLLVCNFVLGMPTQANSSNWESMTSKNGHTVISVTINGVPATAILDTGSTANVISEWMADHLKDSLVADEPTAVVAMNGREYVQTVSGLKLGVHGETFAVDEVLVLPIAGVDMVIGLPFFWQNIVQLDYPNERFRLLDRKSSPLDSSANIKMRRDRRVSLPIVFAEINAEQGVWLVLDTGNNMGLFLPRSLAEKHGWLERFELNESFAAGADGIVRAERFVIPSLQLGPHQLESVEVMVPAVCERSQMGIRIRNTRSLYKFGKSNRGLMGLEVLKHFVVTIDYRFSRLQLKLPAEDDNKMQRKKLRQDELLQ